MTKIPDHFSTLLTPAGSGAIALIRVTGRDAMRIISRVFEPVKQAISGDEAVNKLSYGWIVQDGERIDDVIVSCQQQASPPFVDISMHAGIRIVERILATLSDAGAPLLEVEQSTAWPTSSLIEQEALTALQQTKSKHGASVAMRLWMDLRPHLMQLADRIQCEPENARKALIQLMRGYPQTRALLSGISITLVGPPNSGKSTLFNRLLGRSAAIVNDLAGTTRDWITGEVEIGGLPVSLIDTAGLHNTQDNLENIAIAKGFSMTANVDGCILVLDSSTTVNQQGASLNLLQNVSIPTVIAFNKCDLTGSPDVHEFDVNRYDSFTLPSVQCSAATGEGIDSLMQTMLLTVGVYPAKDPELSLFTQRQIEATQKILDLLKKSPSRTADSIVDDLIQPVYPV